VSLLKALVAIDVRIMRVLGGKPNETLSAAAWNAHITGRFFGWTYHIIDLLFYPLERNHCEKSWLTIHELYV